MLQKRNSFKVENMKVTQTSKMGKFCFAILDIVLMKFYEKRSKSKRKKDEHDNRVTVTILVKWNL